MNETTIQIPIGWILATIGTLGAVIATLARIIWSILRARLEAQDKIIQNLQADIARVSKGCGAPTCLWRFRDPTQTGG